MERLHQTRREDAPLLTLEEYQAKQTLETLINTLYELDDEALQRISDTLRS